MSFDSGFELNERNNAFIGTGITWMGTIPTELPQGSATAEYSIDSQSTTTFTLAGHSGSSTQYFQEFFQVGGLSAGHHTLVVTSRGKTSLTPLVLNNFIIHGGSFPEPADPNPGTSTGGTGSSGGSGSTSGSGGSGGSGSSNPGSSGNSTSNVTTSSGEKQTSTPQGSSISGRISATGSLSAANGSPTGGALDDKAFGSSASDSGNTNHSSGKNSSLGSIVGGALGGILLILLILASVVYCRRRKRNRMNQSHPRQPTNEFEYTEQVQPFYTDAVPNTSHNHAGGSHANVYYQQMGNIGASKNTGLISRSNTSASSPATSSAFPSTMGSVSGASDQLLRPSPTTQSSKSREAVRESTQTGSSAPIIVNHQDSGYRMPQPESIPSPSSTEFIEYPPMYTPS